MPATLRKVFLWIHLVLGVATAVVALSLCVSGALLAAELPVTRWAERRLVEPPATATPGSLPELETLVPKIVAQSERAPEQITVGHDPRDPLVVSFGRREQSLYDPWTGEALGEGPAGIEGFFRKVMTFHRWFSLEGSGREAARAIVGVSTLIFVLMIPTGLLLWLPRRWRWPAVRSVLLFRRGLSGKARDFNWHNVLGFWSALVLLVLALTGAGIAYDWVGNGLTRLAGGEVSEGGRGGPGRGGPGGGGPGNGGPGNGPPGAGAGGGEGEAAEASPPLDERLAGVDAAFERVASQSEGWQRISLSLPADADSELSFQVDRGNGRQPQRRTSITMARGEASAAALQGTGWSSLERSQQVRSFIRFGHTGEMFGGLGMLLAALASLAGAVLAYTGVALTWRRWRAWQARRERDA